MTLIRKAQQQAFLHKLARAASAPGTQPDVPLALLIYGSDTGGVRTLAEQALQALLGKQPPQDNGAQGGHDDAGQALAVEVLDEEMLKEDPGRLADEAQAISMFGDRRVVRVRNAGAAFLKAMQAVLQLPAVEAFIIAEAPGLKSSAALAKLFEKEKRLAALPVYADDAADVQRLIDTVMRAHGLQLEPDARALLAAQLGADQALSRMELEKLALYCAGSGTVTVQDVQAICSDVSAHLMQDMLDAFFSGDGARGVRLLHGLLQEGVAPAAVLAAAANHIGLLRSLRAAMEQGASARQVVERARPPVFFKRREVVARQLAAWTPERLARADESVWQATLATRRHSVLEQALTERCLLSLALQARQHGRRAA